MDPLVLVENSELQLLLRRPTGLGMVWATPGAEPSSSAAPLLLDGMFWTSGVLVDLSTVHWSPNHNGSTPVLGCGGFIRRTSAPSNTTGSIKVQVFQLWSTVVAAACCGPAQLMNVFQGLFNETRNILINFLINCNKNVRCVQVVE